jgi:Mor family transcriptional regulator
MDWLKEIDYEKILPEEYNEIIELIGLDNFIKLFERFSKLSLYFSETPINRAKKEYVKMAKRQGSTPREIARKLGVSERFVYGVISEKHLDNYNLFEN